MPNRQPKPLPELKQSDIDRFWSKVNKDGPVPADKPELGQCWEWTDSLTCHGYGRFGINGDGFFAHRISFLIQFGYDPRPLDILHLCNNPKCMRHIKAGTPLENIRSAYAQGRIKHVRKNPIRKPHELYRHVSTSNPIPPLSEDWIDRFLAKIDRHSGQGKHGNCHLWTGWTNKGYGYMGVGSHQRFPSNRLAYFLEYGVDPGDLFVLHSCDERACCRKEHLSLGTYRDNMLDMQRKNRQVKGESHGMSKITKADTLDFIKCYANGESQRSIAKRYGVCVATVNLAIRGKTFKD